MPRTVIARVGDGLFAETPGHIRHVGATEPDDTTGWADRDLWYDTSTEGPSASGTFRRWDGDSFVPAQP